jgi:hypothetical protein
VVQGLFERSEISILRPLINEILKRAVDLTPHQYGNYILQSILETAPDEEVSRLVGSFRGHFYRFSMHKFASNVIEKCIRRVSSAQRTEIFQEIIGVNGRWEEGRILEMVGDQFGNYVIQRILEFGSREQLAAISRVVKKNREELSRRSYAKHVLVKLENLRLD